ncbi:beta strand repeat-containing protein [Roseomonas sp. USHLN139]|uniref:beta strand repeat-containing protein n=1 Tax=Roseomonas sp. USHLN139 TaxID=3081298 RepID=UPI003B0233F1
MTISGLPAGATLSAGTLNPDGSYTLTQAQLSGLTLTAPDPGNTTLTVTATVTDSGSGTTATSSATLGLSVLNLADAPGLTLPSLPLAGLEDVAIALPITLAPLAASETVSVTISGMPAGATLSAGTLNPDGSYTLTQAQLSGLTLTAPDPGNTTLTVTATVTDSGSGTTATSSATLGLTVLNLADAPGLTLPSLPLAGLEDVAIALPIALAPLGASETVSVTVSGLPAGATLSAGTLNPDGSYTLTQAQLTGLTLTAADPGSATLTVTATVTDSGSGTTATSSATIALNVLNLADAPGLTLPSLPLAGLEDVAIALPIALAPLGASETVSVTVSGLPAGATLSAGTLNPDGSYTLTQAQLTGLTLTAADPGSTTLTVTATVTDSGSGTTATSSATLGLTVLNLADAPGLTLPSLPLAGLEDVAIALPITLAPLGASETVSVTVSGLPAGATLSAGTLNPDGSYTLTQAQLTGLTLTAADPGSTNLHVTATVTDSGSGTTATSSATLGLNVLNLADAPGLTLPSLPLAGLEDVAIALPIALAPLGASETVSVTVSGLPAGATLSAGTLNPDGSYTLTQAQLSGLTITAPDPGNTTLQVTATVTDSGSGTTATSSATLGLTVLNLADAPGLTLPSLPLAGLEDVAIALPIALAPLGASETVSVTVSGLPAGATLSAGTLNPDGSYTLTQAQLTGLTLTAADPGSATLTVTATVTDSGSGTTATSSATIALNVLNLADAPGLTLPSLPLAGLEDVAIALPIALAPLGASETVSVTISGLPAGATLSAGTLNPDGSYTLTQAQLTGLTLTAADPGNTNLHVTATVTDSLSHTSASTAADVALNVIATPTLPTLTLPAIPIVGLEDAPILLPLGLSGLNVGSLTSVSISGLPAGASLSVGVLQPDGSYMLDPGNLLNNLLNLSLTAPEPGTVPLQITISVTEPVTHTVVSTVASLPITVQNIADAPTITVPAGHSLTILEDAWTSLPISISSGAPTESITSIRLTNLPSGATLNHGVKDLLSNDWTLNLSDLSGLQIDGTAPGSANIGVTATVFDSSTLTLASSSTTLSLTVLNTADPATLNLPLFNNVNAKVGLSTSLASSVSGLQGSETVSITVSGLAPGATLSTGALQGDGSYVMTASQFASATVKPTTSTDFDLTITATTTDSITHTTASVTDTLHINAYTLIP